MGMEWILGFIELIVNRVKKELEKFNRRIGGIFRVDKLF